MCTQVAHDADGGGFLGAAQQSRAGGLILGVLQLAGDAHAPDRAREGVGGLQAADPGPVDVLQLEVRIARDQVVDLGMEHVEPDVLLRHEVPLPAGLHRRRILLLQLRIAAECPETLARRRSPDRAPGIRRHPHRVGQIESVLDVPCEVLADCIVITQSAGEDPYVAPVIGGVLEKDRDGVGVFRDQREPERLARHVLVGDKGTGDQRVLIAEPDRVLPVDNRAFRLGKIRRLLLSQVVRVEAQVDDAGPVVRKLRAHGQRNDLILVVLAGRGERRAGAACHELVGPFAVPQPTLDAPAVAVEADFGLDSGVVPAAVEVCALDDRVACRAHVLHAAADSEAACHGAGGDAELQRLVLSAAAEGAEVRSVRRTGDDIDHAADRVLTIQRRARCLYDLDPLDHLRRYILDRRETHAGGIDSHAVD